MEHSEDQKRKWTFQIQASPNTHLHSQYFYLYFENVHLSTFRVQISNLGRRKCLYFYFQFSPGSMIRYKFLINYKQKYVL